MALDHNSRGLLLIDGIVALRFLRYGLPKRWVTKIANDVIQGKAVPLAMTPWAWLFLELYILVQVLLCYCMWRFWRSEAVRF
jgi:hypothetical protein